MDNNESNKLQEHIIKLCHLLKIEPPHVDRISIYQQGGQMGEHYRVEVDLVYWGVKNYGS